MRGGSRTARMGLGPGTIDGARRNAGDGPPGRLYDYSNRVNAAPRRGSPFLLVMVGLRGCSIFSSAA